jgi:hypothetical protein
VHDRRVGAGGLRVAREDGVSSAWPLPFPFSAFCAAAISSVSIPASASI